MIPEELSLMVTWSMEDTQRKEFHPPVKSMDLGWILQESWGFLLWLRLIYMAK